ncbi:MAG: hypothetical protein RIC55_11945 [Pirellulaceae bacterium]
MKRPLTILCTALAVALAAHFSNCFAAEEPAAKPAAVGKYKLPEDPEAAVIVLDFKGGFTPPRISEEPTMTIRADGSVVIPAKFEGQKSFRGKISREELNELLDFAIEENKFLEYDAAKVAEKLAAGGPRFAVADAATTVLKINVNGETKEASHYALGMTRNVEELQRLFAIQQRLMQLQSVIQLGGQEQVKKWLAVVNTELKAKFPDAPALTLEDFNSGGERGDGSIYASFQRIVKGDDPAAPPSEVISGFVNKPAEGEPRINVNYRKS